MSLFDIKKILFCCIESALQSEQNGNVAWIDTFAFQAYDLREFDPPYLTPVEKFSSTGLQQMRTVLNMLGSTYPGTQPILPPICHPTRETKSLTHHYSVEDHKNDVLSG